MQSECELKPCPFCGHDNSLVMEFIRGSYRGWGAKRRKCLMSLLDFETKVEAVAGWNSRPPSLGERAEQQLATAKAALERIADGFDVSPPMLPTRMVCIAAEALCQINEKGGAK